MLIDTHCHLDFPDFEAERDAIIERARAAGVGQMITISTRREEVRTRSLASRNAMPMSSARSARTRTMPDEELDIETADLVQLVGAPQGRGDR